MKCAFQVLALLAVPSIGAAQTIHPPLYATDFLDTAGWVRETEAAGDPGDIRCESQPFEWAADQSTSPTQLHAFLFDVFTPPAGEEVTGLWVDVLARYGDNANGGIRVKVRRDNGQQVGADIRTCFSSGSQGNCRWRLSDANNPHGHSLFPAFQNLGIPANEIQILDVLINRITNAQECTPNDTNLKVKAIRFTVETSPCSVTSFCPNASNSTGQQTRLIHTGDPSQSAGNLNILVQDAPARKFGLLWWGTPGTPAANFDGVLCLGSPARMNPVVQTSLQGTATIPVDLGGSVFSGTMLGQTIGFQFVHRDSTPSGAIWSRGLQMTICQ